MVVPDTNIKNSNDLIFSLDIGTKTIVGIVGVHENGKFKIIESCIKEHNRSNMYDGQIHDIEGVTRIIKEIKKELEEKLEIPLKNVSIAAAGRALKTYRFKTNKDIDSTIEIDNNMIKALEMEGIQTEIIVNGAKGNLKTVLQNKDFVEVKDSTKGEIRNIYLYNIIPTYEKVILNGEEVKLLKEAKVNSEIIEENIQIHEGDKIEYYKNETIHDLLEDLNIDEYNIFKNGEQVGIYENIKDKDEIDIKLKSNKNLLEKEKNEIDLIVNGESKKFTYTEKEFLFVNIFNYIDFNLSKPKGKLILKVNNRDAQYMEVLENGDNVEIYWSK